MPFAYLSSLDDLDGILSVEGRLSGNQDSLNVGIIDQLLRGTVRPARGCQPFPAEGRHERLLT